MRYHLDSSWTLNYVRISSHCEQWGPQNDGISANVAAGGNKSQVLLVLALSRQFWLCSVYFSVRNPFIVANCIEERASRLDGEVLAGVLFGRSGGFPRPQNVLSIEESRGHLDVDDDKRLEALMWKATATPVESNALSASTATRVKSNLPSAATATLVKSNLPSASMSSATATPTKSSALSASVTPTTTSSARRR
jgi:hypothetical protein